MHHCMKLLWSHTKTYWNWQKLFKLFQTFFGQKNRDVGRGEILMMSSRVLFVFGVCEYFSQLHFYGETLMEIWSRAIHNLIIKIIWKIKKKEESSSNRKEVLKAGGHFWPGKPNILVCETKRKGKECKFSVFCLCFWFALLTWRF